MRISVHHRVNNKAAVILKRVLVYGSEVSSGNKWTTFNRSVLYFISSKYCSESADKNTHCFGLFFLIMDCKPYRLDRKLNRTRASHDWFLNQCLSVQFIVKGQNLGLRLKGSRGYVLATVIVAIMIVKCCLRKKMYFGQLLRTNISFVVRLISEMSMVKK